MGSTLQNFFVGYDSRDPEIFLADIYDQFDIESKSDVRELGDGATRSSIDMQLGVTQKKPFVTGWFIDGAEAKPRFITTHRMSQK